MIRPNVDLNESFEDFKTQFLMSQNDKRINDALFGHPLVTSSLNRLLKASERLLTECTQPDTVNDLPSDLFHSPAAPREGNVSDNSLLHY